MQNLKINTLIAYTPRTPAAVQGWRNLRKYLTMQPSVSYGRAVRLSSSKMVHMLVQRKVLALAK